ncbi:tripartite tricarboxylate transporter TctB family protein [Paracoccus spongiarum]|uniref:Tripartite tricarboxylate transporter TctB family protein n=1 Tax=Paracoccus spongiarum TaxID=3064387 RepID=A0ABT9J8G2_9RHOB|nr:tripartite tricarboxylate transporter TctB family protein [Paracoccus sp. 2205BS29-5]MDP5306083.1 tripartite tricarboxylate transporter TctB family protein [Paracoccus sp. 2205BS29-5]
MIRGDRIFGAVMIVVALGYILSASSIQTSFMSDPVGPRIFPYMIAAVVILSSLVMVLRPDPDQDWPAGPMVAQLGLALAVLVGYAYAITPLGFILPTTIAAGVISWQIGGNPRRAAIAGLGLAVGLFVLFRVILGLGLKGLPAGMGF